MQKCYKATSIIVLTGATFLLAPQILYARTWLVLNDGSGDAPTIQAGIDNSATGDTVLVGPGTYVENLSIVDKDLILRSDKGPELTILDGSGQQQTVLYLSGLTRATVVEGFTITAGTGRPRDNLADGGGIHLDNQSSPVIRNNHIVRNGIIGLTFFGGGIVQWTAPASPLIENNLFEGNEARLGGAIALASGSAEIRDNVFRDNSCETDGGGIWAVFNSGFVKIDGNQFWDNFAGDHSGAIHIGGRTESEIRVVRNLFVRNRADGVGGGTIGGSGGAIRVSIVHGVIVSNTFVENVGGGGLCGGGALAMRITPADLLIYGNLFALNRNCAIRCWIEIQNTLGPNLFWANEYGDIGGTCPSEWADTQIFADPLFCGPEADNYTVSVESPALTGPILMGVWTTPGCGPGVPVHPTTWGRLKALYR